MASVVTFGDNVVDCYEDRGLMFPGGNALNVSVFASRFGAKASYVGAASEDAAGRLIRDALVSERVDISRLRMLKGRTAFCVVGIRNGEREFLRADLGVSIIAPDRGDLDHIAGFEAVHTGRSSQVEDHVEAFAERTRLSFDFADVRDPAQVARITPRCFLASFSGGDLPRSAIKELFERAVYAGARWCLVTRGPAGAVLAGKDGVTEVPAARVKPLDTLGAGDTFIARTLVGLLNGEETARLLSAASEAAAETCARIGAFGYPAPIEIDESHARTLEEIYTSPACASPAEEAG